MNLNARSIVNKAQKLEALILGYNPHVVVLTETWLRQEICDEDVFPPSYRAFRRDRASKGGGVAILVKHDIKASMLRQIQDHESVILKISFCSRSFTVLAVYRAPDSSPDFFRSLYDYMNTCRHEKAILTGDFNLPGIDWSSPFPKTKNYEHASYLFDIMISQNMHQIVTHPTRVQGASASMLDLVFITRSIEHFSVSVDPGLSDHDMVYFSCPVQAVCTAHHAKATTVKDFSRARDETVLDHLDISLSSFHGTDPELLWNKFKEICLYCLENFIPTKVKRTRKSNPWITRNVLQMKRKLKRLKRKCAPRNVILSAQATLNDAVRIAKCRYFQHTLPNFITSAP